MSLIRRQPPAEVIAPQKLITLRQAAEILCLDESTIRKRQAGTENLTLIRQGTGGRRRVFLLQSEVQAHIDSLIAEARARDERTESYLRAV